MAKINFNYIKPTKTSKGEDRWGDYYDMTGYEEAGKCFWCGTAVKNRRFCNGDCQQNYQNHFIWKFASAWCIERADNKCEKCGTKQTCYLDFEGWNGDISTRLESHHIIALKGDTRYINKLNRPENLVCLCNKCHNKEKAVKVVDDIQNELFE